MRPDESQSMSPQKQPPQEHPAEQEGYRMMGRLGSVVDFSKDRSNPRKSAIVNAANNTCLGGGGVDGAISVAGGKALHDDRLSLRVIGTRNGKDIRCKTGSAVVTGPNKYGDLLTPYVIHAVGPNYGNVKYRGNESDGDIKLKQAYESSMLHAKNLGIERIGFSLLSAGKFLGNHDLEKVLKIAMKTIDECYYKGLREVHLCAHTKEEFMALFDVVNDLKVPFWAKLDPDQF